MTPIDKSVQLVNLYYPLVKDERYSATSTSMGHETRIYHAKRAATICVDEIIQELEPDDLFKNYNERVTYWRDVKAEIEKL